MLPKRYLVQDPKYLDKLIPYFAENLEKQIQKIATTIWLLDNL